MMLIGEWSEEVEASVSSVVLHKLGTVFADTFFCSLAYRHRRRV
jgi:hypothetical protein